MSSAFSSLLAARRFAVIGVSQNRLKVGHQIFANLLASAKTKHIEVFPIHPTEKKILGQSVYPSLVEVTEPIDVVVVAIPALAVLDVVDQIIERNHHFTQASRVKAVILITAGFAEIGAKGKKLQHAIATKLALAGIRLLGPNTLGAVRPVAGINASFGQRDVPVGNVGIISQSGAMLTAIFDAMQQRNVGVSFAVSLGNAQDLNENDALEFALHDPHTKVVVAYVESFQDLPRFLTLASAIRPHKPLLVLKGGISERGQKASASHTAALATNQVLLDAAAKQVGFSLVHNVEELLNALFYLAHHHPPQNVMVITNAGGPGVNTVDELSRHGVPLARWSGRAKADIEELLPGLTVNNPLDILGDADPTRLQKALQIAQRDVNVTSVLVILTPQAVTDMPGMVKTLLSHVGRMPIFAALVGGEHLENFRRELREGGIISLAFPNDLAALLRPLTQLSAFSDLPNYVASPVHLSQFSRKTSLKPPAQPSLKQGFSLLQSAGIKLPRYVIIQEADLNQFSHIQYPVFAKTGNLSIVHKKDAGAIFGLVRNAAEAVTAYKQLSHFGNDVIFQALVDIEHELLLGYENDPHSGPYMTIGWGGSLTNILADRQYVFLPTHKSVMSRAWQATKAATTLGKTGEIAEQIVETMMSVQKLVITQPQIQALEINPLVITSKGKLLAADLKLRY